MGRVAATAGDSLLKEGGYVRWSSAKGASTWIQEIVLSTIKLESRVRVT